MKEAKIPSPGKSNFLGMAKGFSIILIVLYHYFPFVQAPELVKSAAQVGGAGIYIFLFASGYGLYHSTNTSWGQYIRKRSERVLLPYFLVITVLFAANAALGLYPDGWQAYLSHLFLFKMFYEPFTSSFGNHFWFVSTILQFYMLWPLIAGWVSRHPSLEVLAVAITVSICYSLLIYHLGLWEVRVWFRFVLQYIWVLVLGAVVAKEKWLPKLLNAANWSYAGIAVINLAVVYGIYYAAGKGGMLFNDYFMFMAFFSGCVFFYRISNHLPALQKIINWIDEYSYYIYLLHMFVLVLYSHFRQQEFITLMEVGLVFSGTLLVAYAFKEMVDNLLLPLLAKTKNAPQIKKKDTVRL